jgi:uroporphyrinogen decarboxylase
VAHRPGPAFQICEDLACKHGLMFNPQFLRRVFFPRLRELCEIIHAAGLKVILHTDGDVSEVLDDIVDAGVDGLNPLESMDLATVKQRYGKNLVLAGNVASDVLSFGTPADVRRAVAANIRAGWGSGGHWLDTSAGEFMPDVPRENALAYFAAAKAQCR